MSITINSLTKSFGEKTLFRDFSYVFEKTGVYLIKGKSGGGKTTLLRMIAGLDTDFSGTIEGAGVQNVSFCFQEYRLFDALSALDNVTKAAFKNPTKQDEDTAKNLLLSLKFNENELKLRPKELSGGMKQRVNLARAILRDTPILLLDEPTKELDEMLVSKALELIKNEGQRRLVILVTHDNTHSGEIADAVIELS